MQIYKLLLIFCFFIGCVHYSNYLKIGVVNFIIPDGFKIIAQTKDLIDSAIPGQKPTIEHFISLEDSQEKKIFIFYWEGSPIFRDRGPMSIKKSWEVSIKERKIEIYQTDMFFGRKQEVLTTTFSVSNNDSLLIYTPNIELEEFKSILNNIVSIK